MDVTLLFLERADMEFGRAEVKGGGVVDRPGGGLKDEKAFLGTCVDALQDGTDFWKKQHTAFVVSAPSKFLRLLPLAAHRGQSASTHCDVLSRSLLTLPTDPPVQPRQDGSGGTCNFQLHPAFWFGMALCDNQSAPNPSYSGSAYPNVPCTPNSDSNIQHIRG